MKPSTAILFLKECSKKGKWREALQVFNSLNNNDFRPNTFTLSYLLKSLSNQHCIKYGKAIHCHSVKLGFWSDAYVTNDIVIMYAEFDYIHDAYKMFGEIPQRVSVHWNTMISCFFHVSQCGKARELFEQMPDPNVITWSAMIAGYAQNGHPKEALRMFMEMRNKCTKDEEGDLFLSPNSNTIASVLSACVQSENFSLGQQVHGYTIKISSYVECNAFVGNVLIDFYGHCACPNLARSIFDSMIEKTVVGWSTLIAIYLHNGCILQAIRASKEMVWAGIDLNYVTLCTMVNACAKMHSLILGKEIHGFIIKRVSSEQNVFICTSLINMYANCKFMSYAYRVFEKSRSGAVKHDITAIWNAIISGYVKNESMGDAWLMARQFCEMAHDISKPNSITMAILLPMCSRSSSLLHGKELHCFAIKNHLDYEILVRNNLLDMYSKCGKIQYSHKLFDRMPTRNHVSWTSMINGYGTHGDGRSAIGVFQRMLTEKDVEPDHVTFVALISSCSHSGLVEEGLRFFSEMKEVYGLTPTEENYGSVVDLLARAGRIDEAKEVIASMPMKPGANVWGALLGACRIHGKMKEAESVAQHLAELEPKESGFRKLLSNIYSEIGKSECVVEIRRTMDEIGVKKRTGYTWLETSPMADDKLHFSSRNYA